GIRTLLAICYGLKYIVPVVIWIGVSPHSERNNSFLRESFRKLLVKFVPCICTNFTEAERYFVENLKVPRAKIFHTPYAFDVARFAESILRAKPYTAQLRKQYNLNEVVFLYVGQMIKRKGLNELVNAIEIIDSSYLDRSSFMFIGGT